MYDLHRARFDQGCFGASDLRESELLTSSWFLYEAVHEVRIAPEVRASWERPYGDIKIRGKPERVGWSGGLLRVVQGAWCRWCALGCQVAEASERRLWLSKLTAEELYARHVANDHVPYLKGCPDCIRAQGRQRSHWRGSFTGIHSASFDIAGPFVPGQAFNPEVSGRDKGGGYRYFLACAYSVPDKYSPSGTGEESTDATRAAETKDAAGVGQIDDLFPELWELSDDSPLSDGGAKAVHVRIRGKRPEDEDPISCDPEDPALSEGKESKVKFRTLFLGVPLRTKRGKEVLSQVQCLINRLEAHGYPVNRFHSDRAKELRAAALIDWLRNRGIHATWTPGDSPAGNKAELGVQNLKGLTRKLLGIAKLEVGYWPLALCHATERNWVVFGEALGRLKLRCCLLGFGLKPDGGLRQGLRPSGNHARCQGCTLALLRIRLAGTLY